MEEEIIIFKKKGWVLSEIPYNYVVTNKGKPSYWTSLGSAIRWIESNSPLSIIELRVLTKGCCEKPRRYIRER